MTDFLDDAMQTGKREPLRSTGSSVSAETFGVVSALLWRERETLERLLFKLTEQQLILSSGKTRWLNHADTEVREVVAHVQNHELVRAAEVDVLVREYGLSPETTLRELVDAAPDPWQLVLGEHRDALLALTTEIDAVTAENRRLLQFGEHATREALDKMATAPGSSPASRTWTYGSRGEVSSTLTLSILDAQA